MSTGYRRAVLGLLPSATHRRMHRFARRVSCWRADAPTLVANWLVQRVLRVNSDVPWSVHYTSRVVAPRNIRLGRNTRRSFAVSGGCYVQALQGIEIGDDTLFGPGVKIISANHDRRDAFEHDLEAGPIVIGRGCWIGANAVLLPGVRIGDGCVVGAGAVVTRDVPDGATVVGNPARVLT